MLFVLSVVVLSAAGCVEETSGGGGDAGLIADTGSMGGDGSLADVGGDTASGGEDTAMADAGADGGDTMSGACSFPKPMVAGTSKTDKLAENPEHCGQSSYQWLEDPQLGEVTDYGSDLDYRKEFLESVAKSQGITPPRPLKHDVKLHQFQYKTQDRGKIQEATALVGYPKNYDSEEPVDVVLLLHGTSGFSDMCAPSEEITGQGLAALFASWGYLVVAPDYIGMKAMGEPTGFLHPYLVGQATAIASLDSVRAVGNLPAEKRGDLCPSNEVLTFGGSQGGHAALWVDRLQPYYAREFDLLGTVATVPPAGLVKEGERAIQSKVNATGNLIAFLGSAPEWYGHLDRLDEVFEKPLDKDVPDALRNKCDPSDGVNIPNSTDKIFKDTLIQKAKDGKLDTVQPWGCMAVENGLTTTSVDRISQENDSYGILYVLGENDNLVHTPIERKSYEKLCNGGMPLEFLECKGAGHVETSFWSMPEILDFFDARQKGKTFQNNNCQAAAPVTCRGTP